MLPIFVRVLPPGVRRIYYEVLDHHLPRIFDRCHFYRAIRWVKWLVSPSFRERERRTAQMMRDLTAALMAGYTPNVEPDGRLNGGRGSCLVVESIEPTMKVITFEDKHVKWSRR